MEKYYDCSAEKEWNAARFRGCEHESPYRAGADFMIHALNRMGYELGLWLCSRWDFTLEEERRLPQAERAGEADAESSLAGLEISHTDENLGHNALYMDENTVREQAWFEHLKKFVSDGVRFFKLDPAWLINEFPDRLYGNGRQDEEMHNIAFMLASKQMHNDYAAFTCRRPYGISIAGWAGAQRFAGTWAGDTGGGKQSLVGILQDALIGHAYATCDMNTADVAGIHLGFLLPWALINSWSYFQYPGFQGDFIDGVFRDYSALRMRLLPFYYSLAWQASQSGRAIARPLCLVHPEVDAAYTQLKQFYLGDALLVSVYQDEVVLPAGRWFDMWNSTVVEGAWKPLALPLPENRGGHLLLREGALIPTVPAQQYVGQQAWETVNWLIFPGATPTSFSLYLDDGDSLDYQTGNYAAVTLTCTPTDDGCELTWGAITGNQPERLTRLRHTFTLLGSTSLTATREDGAPLPLTASADPNGFTTGPLATGEGVRTWG